MTPPVSDQRCAGGGQGKSMGRFITGIYNYCDYWCARCPFTQQCLPHLREAPHLAIVASRSWRRAVMPASSQADSSRKVVAAV